MNSLDINLYLFIENICFFLIATAFTLIVSQGWKNAKPYTLPLPFPAWYKWWLLPVQILGVIPPLLAILLYGLWWKSQSVLVVLGWYFIILGLQILTEILTLRKLQNVVWVMVPYIYLPYRLWQLYEGLTFLSSDPSLLWVRYLLIFELLLWLGNYAIDVSQLPRLFRWEGSLPSDSNNS
ncbi:hypothetical protein H6G76_05850 [Nostoc sp. FACHB-152]|uniref:hypothetical protein n=1 Tax=unclassified Nostoc TaxID=2593658 RepID=UPI0016838030|nr:MULTISPECIES: hypothetical protein [unclassified Nostoc]MBD2446697.1 hypothetical protein [Nostoc sp. FACHB-152]MBD2466545.1 hypothetical protein [Nostoc sp. FACHB-145]